MVSCTELVMGEKVVPTASVSKMMMMIVMMYPITAAFTLNGSSLSGSSLVDPSAKEHFASASDPMILFKKKETRGMELRTKPSDTADRSANSFCMIVLSIS